MTASRRLAALPLMLIALAALAVLVLIPWVVHAQTNNDATGRPVVLVSAEGPGILAADTWSISDADGLPLIDYNDSVDPAGSGGPDNGEFVFDFSYQWIRVDGGTDTNIGTDSPRYQLVDADFGKKIKVQVSFTDQEDNDESVTSVPFGPIVRPAPLPSPGTLVGNTGQSPTATKTITGDYAMGFKLGMHGQGYEISSVSIDLAAAPSGLSVSLWTGGPPGSSYAGSRQAKLFEFENPASFQAGLNEFTAPAGVYAYHNLDHWIVLSGFGSSLSIKETTSDDEDAGGGTGATLADSAGGDSSVLRRAIKGSKRKNGILAANFTHPGGSQEIISLGDKVGWGIDVGAADRYLIRGLTLSADDSTSRDGGFDNPFFFRSDSLSGTKHFNLSQTRNVNGLPVWTAPQGATVAGSNTYVFDWQFGFNRQNGDDTIDRIGAVLTRVQQVHSDNDGESDRPTAPGVSLHVGQSVAGVDQAGPTAYMAVHGVPLYAMVQNLGQTNSNYRTVGSSSVKALTQGFTTGSDADGYELLGIGVNIEGSGGNVPDGSASVSVAVHADSGGKPGAKLFDLLSPTEYAAGHSFFEAPRGTTLAASTSYVMVWSYLGGTVHRLRKTGSNSEDTGARAGFSMANAFYQGVDLDNLAVDTGSDVLEMAVYTDAPPPGNATGRPVVLASAQGAGLLFADTEGIADEDGLPIDQSNTWVFFEWSYQWIRVDGDFETDVGADSDTYQPVEADVGKLIKVEVSFTDGSSFPETVTSLPFGPIAEPPPSGPTSTLVSNTGQSASADADITKRYAQGYEISSVSIELAAVPPSLTVSLWSGGVQGAFQPNTATKLFDFANPSSFAVGLNKFTAPAGAFAYQGVNYFIVLSGFGTTLSIKETTSDDEDTGGETGAVIYDNAAVRALSDTGVWGISGSRSSVLRLAVEGSQRATGILASSYAQPKIDDMGTEETTDDVGLAQEIISLGDKIGFGIELGEADRYLIRGVSFNMDDTTANGSGFTNPFDLRSGSLTGTKQFSLTNTRDASGLPVWTAPQGSTVAGGCPSSMGVETCKKYVFDHPIGADDGDENTRRRDATLQRVAGAPSKGVDDPPAAGVSFTGAKGDVALNHPLMALLGEPLKAMVQNLGQTNNSYFTVGDTYKVVSQGFTTGSDPFGYRLQGIGVNIEGSDDSNGNPQVPSGPTSVSVAVHADSNGKPGEKLFDLVSPGEFAAGHSFFEVPPGTNLTPNTSYVLVWRYNRGTWHRLQRTSSNGEDSGARTGASIANGLNRGADLSSLVGGTNKLEIAVYTEVPTRAPFVAGGIEVPLSWFHIPDGAYPGYQFRVLFVTNRATDATSGDIADYNTWVNEDARGDTVRDVTKPQYEFTKPFIRKIAKDEGFKAVVCTEADDNARTNTGMEGIGVPVHWLDGGWQHRDTLVANSNALFFGPEWVQDEWGAHVTGNSASLYEISSHEANKGNKIWTGIWTGCDSTGMAHSKYHMGSAMGMATLGTPGDDNQNGPIGPTASSTGDLAILLGENRPLYGISPIFTVVDDGSPRTIWSTSMTVGPSRTSAGTVTVDRAGVGANHGRLLGSTQFTYEGTSYSITTLQTVKTTNSGSVTGDVFNLQLSTLFPIAADSKLALELDDGGTRRRFLLSEATRQQSDHFYTWDEHGLSWTDGNFVQIKLIELPD